MRRSLKISAWLILFPIALILALLLGAAVYGGILYLKADMLQPDAEIDMDAYSLSVNSDSLRVCGGSSLLLNDYGLWETVLRGTPVDRGASYGRMAEDLLYYQENVFVEQIRRIVPSDSYLRFLRAFLEIFNRDMAKYVPLEHREEIYALSNMCTHEFDIFGSPYERQMHYHAAHDIGHMMQEYMLVGCSSFAVWGEKTDDGKMLIGRNFDFWVGDDFARNRQVLFAFPDNGYRYASVSWPGMTGVVSGMNEKGLTVTMNASKGSIPLSSAMPVALLAKHMLMYASNIDEAYRIASENSLFVSESLLIGSAEDGKAVIIEKTPHKMGMYVPEGDMVLCTNHFQSSAFADDRTNIENMEVSDSRYRYERLEELVAEKLPLDQEDAAAILRDRRGKGGKDVGLANEMTLNQSIAHHSVIFRPEELKMWVSTSPWQSGAYLCYDLKSIFALQGAADGSLCTDEMTIGADSLYIKDIYPRVLAFRAGSARIREAAASGTVLESGEIERFVAGNPEFYDTYSIVGDYYAAHGESSKAVSYWKKALEKEIPRKGYRDGLLKRIKDVTE